MDKIVIYEGISGEFNSQLQSVEEFLNKCMNIVNECTLLNELEIPNSNNDLKVAIYEQNHYIEKLLNNVSIYEVGIMNDDNSYAEQIETTDDETQHVDTTGEQTSTENVTQNTEEVPKENNETKQTNQNVQVDTTTPPKEETNQNVQEETTKPKEETTEKTDNSNKQKDNNSNTNNNKGKNNNYNNNNYNNNNNSSNYYYEEPANTEPPIVNSNESNQSSYIFSTNMEDMLNAGDPFANSEYNITSYTNFLLYKYNIQNEEIAKNIYEALLNYGNNYSQNNNGFNPILIQDENTIIMGIYNILKQKENFDINTYPIFKAIDITKV